MLRLGALAIGRGDRYLLDTLEGPSGGLSHPKLTKYRVQLIDESRTRFREPVGWKKFQRPERTCPVAFWHDFVCLLLFGLMSLICFDDVLFCLAYFEILLCILTHCHYQHNMMRFQRDYNPLPNKNAKTRKVNTLRGP